MQTLFPTALPTIALVPSATVSMNQSPNVTTLMPVHTPNLDVLSTDPQPTGLIDVVSTPEMPTAQQLQDHHGSNSADATQMLLNQFNRSGTSTAQMTLSSSNEPHMTLPSHGDVFISSNAQMNIIESPGDVVVDTHSIPSQTNDVADDALFYSQIEEPQQPFTVQNEYPALTQEFVCEMLKTYMNVLIGADSKQSLMDWIPQVFQGDMLTEIIGAVTRAIDVDNARNEIIRVMVEHLLRLADANAVGVITPWDVSLARNDQLTLLFGPPSSEIPVQLTVGANVYTHHLSRDMMFGLLSMLHGNPQFIFTIGTKQLTLNDFITHYSVNDDVKKTHYMARLPCGECAFTTTDVIRGVKTAAEWLNIDPSAYVADVTGIVDGTRIALKF